MVTVVDHAVTLLGILEASARGSKGEIEKSELIGLLD